MFFANMLVRFQIIQMFNYWHMFNMLFWKFQKLFSYNLTFMMQRQNYELNCFWKNWQRIFIQRSKLNFFWFEKRFNAQSRRILLIIAFAIRQILSKNQSFAMFFASKSKNIFSSLIIEFIFITNTSKYMKKIISKKFNEQWFCETFIDHKNLTITKIRQF